MIRIILSLIGLYLTTGQEFPTNICELPKDIGKCRKYVTKYFYNNTEDTCQLFGWGGCGGNANKFDSVDECESFCKNGTTHKKLRSALKSAEEAPKEVFIGTIVEVDQMETDIIDFESGFGNWTIHGVNIVNLSDSTVNTDAIKVKASDFVLVPNKTLNEGDESELSNSFNIAADSHLEIDFSLYVSGYNTSLVDSEESGHNPSFSMLLEDESSENRDSAVDLGRLPVQEAAWKTFRFKIENKKEKMLKIIFSLSPGSGPGNVIALDDVEIRWIPMLETEADTIHKNILFSNVSAVIAEEVNNIIFNEANNGTENSSEIITTTTTTTTTTTQGLFEELINETINNTSSESSNKTGTEAPGVTGNVTSTINSSYNTTESPLNNNTSDINVTTTVTDNPSIFGPFNTTLRTTTETNNSTIDNIPNSSNSTNIVFPTEKSNSTNIVFPEQNNNETQPHNSTEETTTATNHENEKTTKDDKAPEVTTVQIPGNETKTTTIKTNPDETTTTISPQIESTTYNVSNSSAIKADNPDNGTKYGYTAEVILICLVVIFGLLFLLMVVKYYRLRTTIGDYQIQQGARQTYDNPAFNGFGMQDSYRSR